MGVCWVFSLSFKTDGNANSFKETQLIYSIYFTFLTMGCDTKVFSFITCITEMRWIITLLHIVSLMNGLVKGFQWCAIESPPITLKVKKKLHWKSAHMNHQYPEQIVSLDHKNMVKFIFNCMESNYELIYYRWDERPWKGNI